MLSNLKQWSIVTIIVLAVIASCIAAPWPEQLFLQHLLTAIFLGGWITLQKRHHFSQNSTLLITAFLLLHIFGARWLYSNVPYDAWLQAGFHADTKALFGWTRNHYDRLVHLAYGLCFTLPLSEFFQKRQLNLQASLQQAILWIMVSSLCYEWFEWGIALTLSPASAEGYNGQQGDVWDAHKDMLLATIGSLIAAILCKVRPNKPQQ